MITRDDRILTALIEARSLLRADGTYERDSTKTQSAVRDDQERSRTTARLSASRTHKAGSAEAILQHCLRMRGWTVRYREGRLTGRQRLRLLDDIRFYARAWLRHEAETLFRVYGGSGEPMAVAASFDGLLDRGLTEAIRHHVGRFFNRAKAFTREAILAGVLAFAGPNGPGAGELEAADQMAREQAEFFNRFQAEVEAHPPAELAEPVVKPVLLFPGIGAEPDLTDREVMSAKQFVARTESYGGSVWSAQNIMRAKGQPPGTLEMRVHMRRGQHGQCQTCTSQTDLGWQSLGTLLPIGDSECMGNCDCFLMYSHPNTNKIWVLGETPPVF